MEKYKFFHSCVAWPAPYVGHLLDMIAHPKEREISRRTFLKHVEHEDLHMMKHTLGYYPETWARSMRADWRVTYHRSILRGERVYFFTHSRIEYVFTKDGELPDNPRNYETRKVSPGKCACGTWLEISLNLTEFKEYIHNTMFLALSPELCCASCGKKSRKRIEYSDWIHSPIDENARDCY